MTIFSIQCMYELFTIFFILIIKFYSQVLLFQSLYQFFNFMVEILSSIIMNPNTNKIILLKK